ncbi:peroxisomal membrane protein 4 [Thecamonas trahens ATCC 50062]|uniref:Peroxisomal membrane protein 4 n=1 Tax=Thecamonas trahens ATCC 50062 TaxID=461836 RepID=A0A0L0D3V1_THETB|nr:peroxisomal membrane protein 4 [Thecamonas trahens ATCC 50062]KNC46994.1 peroxisomal membrane protein 4 [Thecamonas trahens ATCC 50062]|eukprot:XP_013759777.1 peroxisomal membrane protein 4 [Thecamonas trahens ATCC 50062]
MSSLVASLLTSTDAAIASPTPLAHTLLAILKGVRNGLVYGVKVRAPHAFVMTFLFRDGSLREKLAGILSATQTHATNLAVFVGLFKTGMALLRALNGSYAPVHPFFSGLVAGYTVFGSSTSVNRQIVLYLFSRVALALAQYIYSRATDDAPAPKHAFPIFAALVWGLVMWLFYEERSTLQSSLRRSMDYLYINADTFSDLRTLLWHNQ